jgi:hypothetical protein
MSIDDDWFCHREEGVICKEGTCGHCDGNRLLKDKKMNDYNNGEVWGWNGGECPVHPESEVTTWFRGGLIHWGVADHWLWMHGNLDSDIIAFQVTKPYVESKVIWVNKTLSGQMIAYESESEARNKAISTYTYVAVKYVEAKE